MRWNKYRDYLHCQTPDVERVASWLQSYRRCSAQSSDNKILCVASMAERRNVCVLG